MHRSNTFKIARTTSDKEFGLSDRFYSISDINYYSEYINKKLETQSDMSPVEIYFNRSQDRFTFKIKSGYYPELLLPKIMKLFGRKLLRWYFLVKYFGQLWYMSLTNHIYTETVCSEFRYSEVWSTDQNLKPLEAKDRKNLALVINNRSI